MSYGYGEIVFTRHADGFEVDRADESVLISSEFLDELPSGPMDLIMVGRPHSLEVCGLTHPGRCYANALLRITSRYGTMYDYRIGQYIHNENAWEAYKQ